ncbi:MAG: hypothetical protein HC888_00205 [Candidatus Competibacteraceae bacterium]|nr:hypothetical protein [Candidatus Competibacteraceae bacterium]
MAGTTNAHRLIGEQQRSILDPVDESQPVRFGLAKGQTMKVNWSVLTAGLCGLIAMFFVAVAINPRMARYLVLPMLLIVVGYIVFAMVALAIRKDEKNVEAATETKVKLLEKEEQNGQG